MDDLKYIDNSNLVRKVVREINIGDVLFEVADYKVKSRIDDNVYMKNRELWRRFPRCFAVIKCNNEIIKIVAGMRKFGDEGQFGDSLGDNEEETEEIYLNKANGEYFGFTVFKIADVVYFVFRSKNVSMIIRERFKEDIILYNESRYEYVKDMAELFFRLYDTMNEEQIRRLKEIGMENIFNMESCLLKRPHVVEYGEDAVYPFALTKIGNLKIDGLVSYLPLDAVNLFCELGFPCLPFVYCVNVNERCRVRKIIYEDENSEGAVVYKIAIDKQTGHKRVYQMYKFKNFRYVFWRAVREKMRGMSTISGLLKRLNALHCKIDDCVKEKMIAEAIGFYAYCWNQFSENWGSVFSRWTDCMTEFRLLDLVDKNKMESEFRLYDKGRVQMQIMTIGIPGVGKSTILKCLEHVIEGAKRVNQDECGNAKSFHKKIKELALVKCLLLDKCFHTKVVRKAIYDIIKVQNLVYLIFYHPDDQDAELDVLRNFVEARITDRGLGHLNLFPTSGLQKILNGFRDSFEPLDDVEISMGEVICVDVTKPLVNNVLEILEALNVVYNKEIDLGNIISTVLNEEQELAKQNMAKMKTFYWSAVILDFGLILNNDIIKEVLSKHPHFEVNKSFHCTMLFVDGKNIDESIVAEYEGKVVKMTVKCIAYDHKIIALVVDPDFYCNNNVPHVTLARAKGVQPVYSNLMLASEVRNEIQLDMLTLEARVIREIKQQSNNDQNKNSSSKSTSKTAAKDKSKMHRWGIKKIEK